MDYFKDILLEDALDRSSTELSLTGISDVSFLRDVKLYRLLQLLELDAILSIISEFIDLFICEYSNYLLDNALLNYLILCSFFCN